jgi:hypothetical protein
MNERYSDHPKRTFSRSQSPSGADSPTAKQRQRWRPPRSRDSSSPLLVISLSIPTRVCSTRATQTESCVNVTLKAAMPKRVFQPRERRSLGQDSYGRHLLPRCGGRPDVCAGWDDIMRASKNNQVVNGTKLQAQPNAIVTDKSLVAIMTSGGLILKNGNDLSDPAKTEKNMKFSWRAFLLTMLRCTSEAVIAKRTCLG